MNYNIETGAVESVISLPICNRVINCDINEDVNIPEGYPDVRRVLALKENILAPSKFIGAKSIDMSGTIDYTIIYLGADGKIYSAPFSAEYNFSLPFENIDGADLNENVNVICSMYSDSGNVRMSTPRRLQIRAGIRVSAICFGKAVCGENLCGVEDESAIERLQMEGNCAFFDCESSDIVMLTDEYLLDSADRIIYSDASAFINDVRVDGEVVRAVGEVQVKLVLQNGDNIESVIRKIPFDAETDLDELDVVDGTVLCRAYGTINELDVSVIDGRAHIDVGIILDVCVAQNRSVEYTRDIYSTKQVCDVEYKKLSLPLVLLNKNVNITQSERIASSDVGFPDAAQIVDVWGSALCEEGALENRRYVLRGKVKYKMICRNGGDISTCEAELPFKYEAELGEVDASGVCADVRVMGARARCDGENLLIESELAISASMYGSCELDVLSKASFGEEVEQAKNQFVVCFKASDESVFDLAKRYFVPCDKISEQTERENFVIIER